MHKVCANRGKSMHTFCANRGNSMHKVCANREISENQCTKFVQIEMAALDLAQPWTSVTHLAYYGHRTMG